MAAISTTIDIARVSAVLNEKYADAMSNFVFRRVRSINASMDDLVEVRYYTYDDGTTVEYEVVRPEEIAALTPKEIEQYVEFRYRKFNILTYGHAVREDEFDGSAFQAHSNNLGVFNPITLQWSRDREVIRSALIVPPRENDLVCGIVDPARRNSFKYWFVCSEQFLRFWTAVMFEEHESFDVKCRPNPNLSSEEQFLERLLRIRKWLMSGNRLCTNSFRKWALSEGVDTSNEEEVAKRLYRLRTEELSHMNVHIYAALVLLIRYGELPTDANVPQNIDGPNKITQPKMKHWDLPVAFTQALLAQATPAPFLREPGPNEVINVALLKALTGGDSISV